MFCPGRVCFAILLFQCLGITFAWLLPTRSRLSVILPKLVPSANAASNGESSARPTFYGSAYENQLAKIQHAYESNDTAQLTKEVKSAAATFRETFPCDDLLPIVSKVSTDGSLSNSDICDLLWSAGRMGFKVSKLEHRDACMSLVTAFISAEGLAADELSKGFVGLAKLGLQYSKLSSQLRNQMQYALAHQMPNNMDELGASNILYSLGKMGVRWNLLHAETQKSILQHCFTTLLTMPARCVSLTIYGLGLMAADYSYFSRPLQDVLLEAVARTLRFMSAQGIANTIYGLGQMKVKWSKLPNYIRADVSDQLLRTLPFLPVNGLSCAVYALAQLGAHWRELSVVLKDAIETALQGVEPVIHNQAVASVVHSFGKMDVGFVHLTKTTQEVVLRAVESHISSMNHQGVANTVHGLAAMKVTWSILTPSTRHSIERALCSKLPNMKPQEVASSVYALSKIAGDEVSPQVVHGLLTACNLHAPHMDAQGLANVIYGLGKMKISWLDPPPSVSSAAATVPDRALQNLTAALTQGAPGMREQGISNTIYGMALSGVRWQDLPATLQQALQNAITGSRFVPTPQGTSSILYGMCRLGGSWCNLSTDCKSRLLQRLTALLPRMGEPAIANALHALALLDASWADLPLKLQIALTQALKRISTYILPQELANIMYALAVLSFDEPTSPSFDAVPDETSRNDPRFISRMLLWYCLSKAMDAYKLLRPEAFTPEHRTQFDVFFQYMNATENGAHLVQAVLGGMPVLSSNRTRSAAVHVDAEVQAEGHQKTAQSMLHTRVVKELMMCLNAGNGAQATSVEETTQVFSCENEFPGLSLAFPVDAAIFSGNKLCAFLEVDGETHYAVRRDGNGNSEKVLHRVDQLKERLYCSKYPDVPFYRIR